MTLLTGTECSLPLSPPTSALPRFPLSHPFVLKVKIAHTIIFSLLIPALIAYIWMTATEG